MRIVKEATERRNEILDVAERLFCTQGYDNTSTNDILAEIGIARGTLYYHFRNKEDILDAMIDRILDEIIRKAEKFDDSIEYSAEVKKRMVLAFISNAEILLHMEKGSLLEAMVPMFYRK
ncbi:MAG: helix-turn-helix domain-containing protein [Blautia sp.]|nr:TetR/AcrR family transcriptional regulator [Blautia sp.]MDY4000212.1 helix-turn-helix domain-containing protein [Blautia sp.]